MFNSLFIPICREVTNNKTNRPSHARIIYRKKQKKYRNKDKYSDI